MGRADNRVYPLSSYSFGVNEIRNSDLRLLIGWPEKSPPSLSKTKFGEQSFFLDNKSWKSQGDFCTECFKLKVNPRPLYCSRGTYLFDFSEASLQLH